MLIDGRWEIPDATRDVTAPADGRVVGTVGWGSAADARRAARAWASRSSRTSGRWPGVTERG